MVAWSTMVWELAVGDTSGHLHLAALQAPWLSLQPCLKMAVTLFFPCRVLINAIYIGIPAQPKQAHCHLDSSSSKPSK